MPKPGRKLPLEDIKHKTHKKTSQVYRLRQKRLARKLAAEKLNHA